MRAATMAREHGRRLASSWQSFWFGNELAYTLGIVRIAFGVLLVGWTYVLASDLSVAFGTNGIVPRPPSRSYTWGIFHAFPSDNALLIGWLVLLGASIALTVGWHSRLAAIIAFILILSFERRDPVIFNSGDTVIRIEALYLALAPCGAALSMDERRRTGSFFTAREFRPWPLRLLQVQLSIIYISTVIAKLAGETWQNGTAVAYSLRQRDLLIVPAPSWLTSNLLIANALTWGTLVVELAIGILVWKRAWRLWVLAGGVLLHLSISLFLEVGFFSCSMFVLYLAFIPPERAEALAKGVQTRLAKAKARFLSRRRRGDEETVSAEITPMKQPHEADPGADLSASRQTDYAAESFNGSLPTQDSRHGDRLGTMPEIPPEWLTDEPTGRHARRTERVQQNGQLTGHML